MIPLLDHLRAEIERRSDYVFVSVFSGLVIVSSKMVTLVYKKYTCKEKFSLHANLLKDDFSCLKVLEEELVLWETYLVRKKRLS